LSSPRVCSSHTGCRAHIVSCANVLVEAAETVLSGPGHAVRLLIPSTGDVANQFSIQP